MRKISVGPQVTDLFPKCNADAWLRTHVHDVGRMVLDGLQPISINFAMIVETTPRPFVKWAGGKQGLAARIAGGFPAAFDVYYEPFLGGGSVFFTLAPKRAVLSDDNGWLMDTYQAVRDDWKSVAKVLDALPNSRSDFLRIRAMRPEQLSLAERAAHFIYLNKTCFRGLFRVNGRGDFNVPYGAYDRRYYDAGELACVATRLASVELRRGDFELGVAGIGTRDFVYFDPPYHRIGGYSDFNRYTAVKFKEQQHIRLASLCRELDSRNVRWALSNSNTGFVRSLYSGFRIQEIDARREINLNSERRVITELLVRNY